MKYRKKPVVIEAIQFNDTASNLEEIKKFVGSQLKYDIVDTAWEVKKGRPHILMRIETLEGDMRVSVGDYIIKGVKGEFYPCKPDIFEQTYETLKDGAPRYIDADEALRMMRDSKKDKPSYGDWDIAHDCCIDCVNTVPTADVVEVKRGEWKEITTHNGCTPDYDCVCSLCGESGLPYENYCSNCGAKMTGEDTNVLGKGE